MNHPVPLNCARCGAPLPVSDRSTSTCSYCGLVSRVRKDTALRPPIAPPNLAQQPAAPAFEPQPAASLSSKSIVIGAVVMMAVGAMTFLLASAPSANQPPKRQAYTGAVPPFAALPSIPKPSVSREADRWMSTPARGADATVAGLVHTPTSWAFVQIDEQTGAERWRTPLPGFLGSFSRFTAWQRGQSVALVPIALEGGDQYLVAWKKEFALLDRRTGALQHRGSFAETVPEVSAELGACFHDGAFWVGVGTQFGVSIDKSGKAAASPSARPEGCFGMAPRGGANNATGSPMRRGHEVARPYPEFCEGNCTRRHGDDDPEHDVMLYANQELIVRDQGTWRNFWALDNSNERSGYYGKIWGLEIGSEQLFLNPIALQEQVSAADPSSFQAAQRSFVERSVLMSIDRDGTWRWGYTFLTGKSGEADLLRAELFASHPRSPTQNLYVFRPGQLLALDQQSGTPRWQLGLSNGDELGIVELTFKVKTSPENNPAYVALVEGQRQAVQSCYTAALQKEGPIGVGRVYLLLRADKQGVMLDNKLHASDLRSTEASSCIHRAFDSLRFQPTKWVQQTTAVEILFHFQR